MFADLSRRACGPELMDADEVDPHQLLHAMGQLQTINRLLNGYGPSLHGVSQLAGNRKHFSVLDVGCGSGDTLRQIATWARRNGRTAELHGIELSAATAARAHAECSSFAEIKIEQNDVFQLHQPRSFDIVHGALLLHHFDGAENAVSALTAMRELARCGVIINDLHRHWFAHQSIALLTRTFSRSQILRNDAPLSVARGFTREELEQFARAAGLVDVAVQWHWAFRWLLVARTGQHVDA